MRRYGLFNFLFDVFMVSVTGGFWLIWIFIREMRRGRFYPPGSVKGPGGPHFILEKGHTWLADSSSLQTTS